MTTRLLRWILSPVRQWRTYRLMAAHGASLTYTTAWCLVVLACDPAELPYVRNLSARDRLLAWNPVPAGVLVDIWEQLSPAERYRRLRWLAHHSATPLYRLGITCELVELAGLYVIEWALPPGSTANSMVTNSQ